MFMQPMAMGAAQPGMSADEMRKLQADLAAEKKAREASDAKRAGDDASRDKLLAEVAELKKQQEAAALEKKKSEEQQAAMEEELKKQAEANKIA